MAGAKGSKLGRSFRAVWLSSAISGTGDGMFLTAFPLLAAAISRDAVLVAGVTIASKVPWLVFSLVAGAIADRIDRRRLMVLADVARAAVVAALAAIVLADGATIWLLYIAALSIGIAETLHDTAAQAILPTIVASGDLTAANARLYSAEVVSEQFAGPPLGAALFAAAPSVPFFADAVSFGASAALVASIPGDHRVERQATPMWSDVREGVRFIAGQPALRRLLALLGVLNFAYFASEAVLVLYTFERLDAGNAVFTALFLAAAAGSVGSQAVVISLQRRYGPAETLVLTFWQWAIGLVLLAVTTTPWVAILGFFLLGSGDGMWRNVTVTLRQRIVPNALLGRATSAHRMVGQGVIPFGAAFGGATAKAFGVRAPFVIAAVVFVALSVLARRLLRPVAQLELVPQPLR